jgi:hypothetical protein
MQLPQNPIFIVGYPRSGTTLLQRLLVTQPGLYSLPETHYFSVIEKQLQLDESGNIEVSCLDTVLQKIAEKMESRFDKEEIEILYQAGKEKKLTSKCIFEFIVTRFLLQQHPGIGSDTRWRWIEKTPTHANFLERIMELYPRAQILHILRHPVPAIFSRKFKFPFNRETPLPRLAHAWNRLVENVERGKEKFPTHIYTLRYEDLVKNMEKEMTAAADFLNILLDFTLISNIKEEQTDGAFILPSETWKLEDRNHSIANTNDTYKNRVSKVDAEVVETIVMKRMLEYGYEPYLSERQ